jgi:hypothetical protein
MANGFAAFGLAIPPAAPAALPTVTFADEMTLHFNGETVQLHACEGHSRYFFTGDAMTRLAYQSLKAARAAR